MKTENLVKNKYKHIYNKEPNHTVFTPYRICPLGAHIDHQLGNVTGFAIDKGVYFAFGKTDGRIEVSSLQFEGIKNWDITNTPVAKVCDWADYLRGVTICLGRRYPLKNGVKGVFVGELPIGGLSSSAAVSLSFLQALAIVNDIDLSNEELVKISKESENTYVGVNCGVLDQSCEVYCKKDSLLYLNIKSNKVQNFLSPKNMKPYEFLVVFSGLERSLANTNYNNRVEECKTAARLLSDNTEEFLMNVPYDTFLKKQHLLEKNILKRAKHFYSELQRVEEGIKYWNEGDIVSFGRLLFESGYSSIHNYEAGCPELIKLHEILYRTKGVYGGRFSGAGFKGCCIAIIDPEYKDEIIEHIEKQYLEAFPEMRGKYCSFICFSNDGVGK